MTPQDRRLDMADELAFLIGGRTGDGDIAVQMSILRRWLAALTAEAPAPVPADPPHRSGATTDARAANIPAAPPVRRGLTFDQACGLVRDDAGRAAVCPAQRDAAAFWAAVWR